MDILWSGSLVVPVIAMCATQSARDLNAPSIAAWIALATLVRQYSGAAETALDQDLRACRSDDPLAGLLSNLRQVRPLIARPEDFSGTIADRSGLLAMYVACYHQGLLDFYNGGKLVCNLMLTGTYSAHEFSRKGRDSYRIALRTWLLLEGQ